MDIELIVEIVILTTSKEEYEQLLRKLLRLETETMIEIKRRIFK